MAINFDIPQFNDLFKLMDIDNGRQRETVSAQSTSSDNGDSISKSAPA